MKSPRLVLSDADLLLVLALIDRLETTPPMTLGRYDEIKAEEALLDLDFIRDSEATIQRKIQLRQERRPVALDEPLNEIGREGLMKRKDDLALFCRVVSKSFDDWLRIGEDAAPYYACRIGVILLKAGRKDLSNRFDAAYDRHFDAAPNPSRRDVS